MTSITGIIRDDFAGPGGWDEGARHLGLATVGVEAEANACATARAAGHHREHATVQDMRCITRYRGGLTGYIASPPCQTFSMAGGGAGRAALAALLLAAKHVAAGTLPEDAVAAVHSEALDVRSVLVLEPLHVIARHRPQWVALEQVPPVLPVWQAYAEHLAGFGYSVYVGYVHSEQHGVPQTRKRAVLVAHQDRAAGLPVPTHSRYHSRTPSRLDPGVLPWVSMAEALDEHAGVQRSNARRPISAPAPTVMFGARSNKVEWQPVKAVPGDTSWVYERPSPTIVGSFAPDVVAAPGYRKPGDPPRQRTPGSVRVTAQEAAVLQSFPADYPWRGARTSHFQQIGNAVPPLMAQAILAALTGCALPTRATVTP